MASFFDSIKNSFYQRSQRKSTVNIARRLLHYDACKSIGILFDATEGESRYQIATYAKRLQKAGKKVNLLAYVHADQIPGELMEFASTYFQDMEFAVFGKKDVNWANVPQGQAVQNFSQQSFDWLLCLYTQSLPQLEYIVNASMALARIGYYEPQANTLYYDVAISAEQHLPQYIEALHQTLKH